jgi:hypothetical protein
VDNLKTPEHGHDVSMADALTPCLHERATGLAFSAIASSKTTVVGVRLDHDRRAWLEAEAERQGMTVRALFERMIDEARAEEPAAEESGERWRDSYLETATQVDDAWFRAPPVEASDTSMDPGNVEARPTSLRSSPCAELANLGALSGQVVVGTARLTVACVGVLGRFALAPCRAIRGR